METLKTIWDFFQNEVLGMNWLNRLIETFLNACGLDTTGKIGGSARRFNFDYLVYSKLFPARKSQKDTRQISRNMGEYHRRPARYGNTVLLVFFHSVVYRVYKRRFAAWRYILLFDFFADG